MIYREKLWSLVQWLALVIEHSSCLLEWELSLSLFIWSLDRTAPFS